MKNKFQKIQEIQETYDQIKAPKELKDSLLSKMKEPQQDIEPMLKAPSKNRFIIKWRYAGLAAAVILCFIIFHLWNGNNIYKTTLKDGEYLSVVELQDGYLQFIESDSIISLTPNAGVIGRQEGENEEQDNEVISIDDGKITVEKRQGKKIKRVQEKLMSNIFGQELVLTVQEGDNGKCFEAEYERDGFLYRISGDNVTQKQFIDFLIDRLKS